MSEVTFIRYHDCKSIRPKMYTEDFEDIVAGRWPFRRIETKTVKVWLTEDAEWTCPKCKSPWVYRYGKLSKTGMWTCEGRTTYRVKENVE